MIYTLTLSVRNMQQADPHTQPSPSICKLGFFKVSSLQTNNTTVCQEHSRDLWFIWRSSVMELKERTLRSLDKTGRRQHAWHDVTFPVSCALTALARRASIKTPYMNWVSTALTPVCCYDWELYCSYLPRCHDLCPVCALHHPPLPLAGR